MIRKIAYLGLGMIGAGMASNFIKAGCKLAVWNRTPAKREPFARKGAHVAQTPTDVVEAISRKGEAEIFRKRPGLAPQQNRKFNMNATIGSTSSRASSSREVRSYAELQERMHRDLLAQHPEWIRADGDCPTCDEYDRRFAELISFFRAANLSSVQRAA